MNIQKTYLKIYRGFGFFLLLSLLSLIVWYIFLVLLFLSNRSWAMPLILSTTQEKVIWNFAQIISLEKEINKLKLNKENLGNELAFKKRELGTSEILLNRVEMSLANQAKIYQAEAQTMKKDLTSFQLAGAGGARNDALTKIKKELNAGLITKEQAANYLSTQYDTIRKTHQSNSEIQAKIDSANTLGGGALSADAMILEAQKTDLEQKVERTALEVSSVENELKLTENSINDYSHVIDGFYDNIYYDAKDRVINAAFVPYDNIDGVEEGDPVYGCALKVIFCSKVGVVTKVYGAEETSFHYLFKTEIKGKFVSVQYNDNSYADAGLVFIGRKPLFF
ncbi:hypothetical protein [Hydromonas duriensis]|nr:hypothetical protein [Hydromonas duriensis]